MSHRLIAIDSQSITFYDRFWHLKLNFTISGRSVTNKKKENKWTKARVERKIQLFIRQ